MQKRRKAQRFGCWQWHAQPHLQTLVAAANAEKALTVADGAGHLLGAIKFPDTGTYTPTITNGMDVDSHNAVTDAQTLAAAWLGKK
jgi:hypothetical protein